MKRVNRQYCKALKCKKFDAADNVLDDKILKLVAKCVHQMYSSNE